MRVNVSMVTKNTDTGSGEDMWQWLSVEILIRKLQFSSVLQGIKPVGETENKAQSLGRIGDMMSDMIIL